MSDNNERDQGDISSNTHTPYPPPAPSQYPHPQPSYGYSTNEYPPISDHDLAIAGQGYPPPLQIATQLQDAAQAARTSNGEAMRVNTNGSAGIPGMAPPQTQGTQGFSPGASRPSVDATPNSATPNEQKGKRGKASQACDECRRKKTKCITSIDEDGVPTTCASCAKAGIDCTYSRQPMKRGPNKGYIKDLADRVQQVESLLPAYRQSFDGDIFGASGDEPMSGRRNYSLPGVGRTSFSGPDFGRDRLGSFGAYPSATSQPARQRDRFSIAVPPDQPIPTNVVNLYSDVEERPAKRLKMDNEKASLLALQVEADDIAKYYELIHAQFPILPDASDSVIKIVSKAIPELQHGLVAAISLLPNTATSQENGYKQKSSIKTVLDMADHLQDVCDSLTSAADVLAFIWVATILVYHTEYAVDTYGTGPLASPLLVRKNLELLPRICDSEVSTYAITAEKASTLDIDLPLLQDAAARASSMAILQANLSLLATGHLGTGVDDTTFLRFEVVAQATNLPSSARFLTYATKSIAWTASLLTARPDGSRKEVRMSRSILDAISEQLDHSALRAGLESTDPLYQQLEEFEKLLTARITRIPTQFSCLFPAAKLAEMLSSTTSTYSPLDVHLYTAAVFTFLEVLSVPSPNNEWAGPLALTGLNSIRPTLQQKAAEYAASRSAADKAFWGTHNGKEMVKMSWVEALSDHIDACEVVNWANTSLAERHQTETGRPDMAANFLQLVNYGYLNVLGHYARRMVRHAMEEDDEATAVAAATAAGGLEAATA